MGGSNVTVAVVQPHPSSDSQPLHEVAKPRISTSALGALLSRADENRGIQVFGRAVLCVPMRSSAAHPTNDCCPTARPAVHDPNPTSAEAV